MNRFVFICVMFFMLGAQTHEAAESPVRQELSLNGPWKLQQSSKDLSSGNPNAGKPYILDDFENMKGWQSSCLEQTTSLSKEGQYSAKYSLGQIKAIDSYTVLPPFIAEKNDIPHDWTGYSALEFWCYSPQKTEKSFITISAQSDKDDQKNLNYFFWHIKLDWEGWKKIRLELKSAEKARSPFGWNKIDSIKFWVGQKKDNPMYKLLQKQSLTLYFNHMCLIPSDKLVTERSFFQNEGIVNKWYSPEYDDSKWKTATVPQTKPSVNKNNIEWYRKKFVIPESFAGKRIILRFDRLMYVAWIWVNGKSISPTETVDEKYQGACHQGLMSGCEFDITDDINIGKENLVAVELYAPECISENKGIARNVSIMAMPRVYMKRPLIDTNISDKTVSVRVLIKNEGNEAFTGNIKYDISGFGDKKISQIGSFDISGGIAPRAEKEIKFNIACGRDIKLWTPDTPALYNLQLFLQNKGETIDELKSRFGFRSFEAKGRRFYLNGNSIFLKGEGWEVHWDKKLRHNLSAFNDLKDLNINIFRCQGLPSWPEVYDQADEQGMMIMDEATAIDPIHIANAEKDAPDEFRRVYLLELPGWIYSNYNHPSIVIWSLGNEQWRTSIPELNEKYDALKKLDASRPVVTSTGGTTFSTGGADSPKFVNYKTDVNDVHCYHGWYEKPILYMEDWIDCYMKRKDIPDRPLINTETVGRYPDAMIGDDRLTGGPWPRWVGEDILTMDLKSRQKSGVLKCADGIKTSVEMWRMRKGDTAGAWIFSNLSKHGGLTAHRDMLKKVFSPQFTCARFYDKNHFTGDHIEFPLFVINDKLEKIKDAKVKISITDSAPKTKLEKICDFGTVEEDGLKKMQASFDVGEWPEGDYELHLALFDGARKINENSYKFFVASSAMKRMSIKTERKVLLLDTPDGVTAKLLKAMNISFDQCSEFDNNANLDSYNVLIVGCRFNGKMSGDSAKTIGDWVERGGRCLCLEQDALVTFNIMQSIFPNFITFYTAGDLNDYLKGQANSFVNIKNKKHPAFEGIEQSRFEDWNGNYNVITEGFFENNEFVEKSAIATVRSSGHWRKSSRPGTVMMNFSYGKGEYLITQLQAISRCDNDPVALRYLQNLFRYFLEQSSVTAPPYIAQKSIGPGPFKPDQKGFIQHFLICGPFPNPGGRPYHSKEDALKNNVGFKTDYFRGKGACAYVEKGEDDIEPVEGMKHTAEFPMTSEGYWNIDSAQKIDCMWKGKKSENTSFLLSGNFRFSDNIVAYAACYIESPKDLEAKMHVNSDDGYRIWINRALAGELNTFRGLEGPGEIYTVNLKKGLNPLLLKITQDTGDCGFAIRFTDMDNQPLTDIKIYLAPQK